jgi:hypothetical protein
MKKFNRIFKRILKKIKNILIKDQYELLEKTLYDIVKRNLNLLQKPQIESTAQAKRGQVYYVEFGFNYGSELRGGHFCVVLATQGNVATVVPFTSKNPINSSITRVNLGIIPYISSPSGNIISYALINQISSISKSRLMRPKINGVRQTIRLTSNQLDNIEVALKKYLLKNP